MGTPLLSVVTITYNHEEYIARTIESVLAQKTSFTVEYILAEDNSPDGTLAICRRYESNYPQRIRVITSDCNVGPEQNEKRAIVAAKGKYIALCEGDDYWTDPNKLQKQVDFMEAHPECSVTFHRYRIYNENTDTWQDDNLKYLFPNDTDNPVEVTMEMFLHRWITQNLTILFRKDAFDVELIERYDFYRDTHLDYHLLRSGKGYIFPFVGGVYNRTGTGLYTGLSQYKMIQTQIAVFKELWKKNDDNLVREMYELNLKYLLAQRNLIHGRKASFISAAFDLFQLNNNIVDFLKYMYRIFF